MSTSLAEKRWQNAADNRDNKKVGISRFVKKKKSPSLSNGYYSYVLDQFHATCI